MTKLNRVAALSTCLSSLPGRRPRGARLVFGSLFAIPVMVGGAASAHEGPGVAEGIEEIVVTAQKREQNAQDVGLSVSVIGAQQLLDRRIVSLEDVALAVPGLTYTNSAENTPVYTLRGVSFYDTSLGGYGAVAVYLDEFPLPFPKLTANLSYDLAQVSVVKGPQGTLFGQNSTGGAINFIAARPTDSLQAGMTASYGRFNEVTAEGFISGPITDKIKARLSGRIERADGWQISNTRPDDRNGKRRTYAGRLLVDFDAAETVRFKFNAQAWKDKSDPLAAQHVGFQGNALSAGLIDYKTRFSPENPRAADWTPGILFADDDMLQFGLRSEVDLTGDITFTALTSYITYNQKEGVTNDGLPILVADHPINRGGIDSFSQEVRLSNGSAKGFRWIVGGNYEKSTASQTVRTVYSDANHHVNLGPLGYPIYENTYSSTQHFRTLAAFANAEIDLPQSLILKGGIRYTDSRDRGRSCNRDDTGDPNNVGAFHYDVLLGGSFGAYQAGECFMINNQSETIGGVAPGAPGEYRDTLHEDNISWTVGLDWKPADALLVYANISKGYKAGSFPTATGSVFTSYLPVRQESVLDYEGGVKWTNAGNTLQINASAFYYDYRDKQLRAKVNSPPFGTVDVLQNIPEASVKGAEVEAIFRPVRGLSLRASYSYLDAIIDEFIGINGAGVVGDFGGTPIPFTPKHQIGFSPSYSFPLNDDVKVFMGGSVNYRSKAVAVVGGDERPANVTPLGKAVGQIDSYVLVDAYAGVKLKGDRWRISVFGKNITNKYYWSNVYTVNQTINRLAGRPATYGISVGFNY